MSADYCIKKKSKFWHFHFWHGIIAASWETERPLLFCWDWCSHVEGAKSISRGPTPTDRLPRTFNDPVGRRMIAHGNSTLFSVAIHSGVAIPWHHHRLFNSHALRTLA